MKLAPFSNRHKIMISYLLLVILLHPNQIYHLFPFRSTSVIIVIYAITFDTINIGVPFVNFFTSAVICSISSWLLLAFSHASISFQFMVMAYANSDSDVGAAVYASIRPYGFHSLVASGM